MPCLSQLIEDLWKKLFSTSLSNNSLIIYLDPSTSSHWLCSIMCKWHLRVKLYRYSRGVLILLYLHEPYVYSTPWEENYQWWYRRDEEATGYQHSPKEITFRESNTSAFHCFCLGFIGQTLMLVTSLYITFLKMIKKHRWHLNQTRRLCSQMSGWAGMVQ